MSTTYPTAFFTRQTPKQNYWLSQATEATARYGLFAQPLLHDWQRVVATVKKNAIREANLRLSALQKKFKFGDFRIDETSDELVSDYANAKAMQCIRLVSKGDTPLAQAARVKSLLEYHGFYFEYEKLDECGELMGLLLRVQDEAWWRRKIRRIAAQRIEAISRELGYVNKARSIYCSALGVAEHRRRKQLNLSIMEATLLENEEGDQFTLADLADTSTANPVIRRTELMVRIAGFEQYAKELGYEGWFYTITTPSKYHAAHQWGKRNSKFAGASAKDAQAYLNEIWQRFRAKAARQSWGYFGFRVAEPHHDGTPHWHLLLFIDPAHAPRFGGVLRDYALKEDGHEKGAHKARFKAEKIKTGINPNTGKEYSAAGYVAKYISKNIDGEHVEQDLYGKDGKASAFAISAWASRNGIRQFQQVGGPKVGGWRELRRLSRQPQETLDLQPPLIKEAAMYLKTITDESASAAWAWYCRFADENGLSIWRVVKTAQDIIEVIDEETGEVCEQALDKPLFNKYREMLEKEKGLRVMSAGQEIYVQTRFHTWEVVSTNPKDALPVREMRKAEKAAREAMKATLRDEVSGASAPPWTGINNCTGSENVQKMFNEKQQNLALEG